VRRHQAQFQFFHAFSEALWDLHCGKAIGELLVPKLQALQLSLPLANLLPDFENPVLLQDVAHAGAANQRAEKNRFERWHKSDSARLISTIASHVNEWVDEATE
jgi:hypothetical protein